MRPIRTEPRPTTVQLNRLAARNGAIITRSARGIPAATVERLRADVLGAATEMVREIQEQIPEYGRPSQERHACALRRGVELALHRYVELLDEHLGPRGPTRGTPEAVDWREVYLTLGANEMRQGRTLDPLHAAVRICARVANRRLQAFAGRHPLPSSAVAWLTEAIFDNVDDVARASTEGYARAQEAEAGELDRRRRRLVDLLIADPPPSVEALAAAAAAAHWPLPRRVAAVAIATPGPLARPPVLSPEILTAFNDPRPSLIVPDPEGRAQVRALVNGLARHRAAVGLAVPPADAGRSLRWARLALDLAGKGLIPRQRLIWCGDHLATLAVFQDQALVAALAQRWLAPLARLREEKRRQLADTLLAWLTFNMNANEVAAHLHLHPQTVRHRLRQLAELYGDRIRDPGLRFEIQIALRAERARSYPVDHEVSGDNPGGSRH